METTIVICSATILVTISIWCAKIHHEIECARFILSSIHEESENIVGELQVIYTELKGFREDKKV